MPGTSAKGTLGIGFEPAAAQGKQLILGPATIAATQSATTQPVIGTVGVRFVIIIQNIASGASATVTIAGLKPDGVTAVTETSTAISQALANANNVFEYTTKAVYGTINASGITASSVTSNALTNATITVYAIIAAKYLVPATVTINEDYDEASPADLRGILDEDTRMIQLIKHVSWDVKSALYPETNEFVGYSAVASATTPATRASLPSTPTTLKASTSFTTLGASYTLTTAPTSPGMLLSFVIASNALAGTLTITGTNPAGQATSEVLSITAGTPNGTFYSANVYATVTSVAITGFTGAATSTTNGVFAYNPVFTPADTLTSLALEWYSGTESSVLPYSVVEEFEIDYDVKKELSLSLKGEAQTKVTIGDRTVAALTTSNFPVYTQPTDYPIPAWGGLFYLDPITGTAGTTQWLDVITFKVKGKTGLMPYWTAVQSQDYNRVGRKRRKTEFEAEIDFTNVILYDKYRAFQKQLMVAKFQSVQAYLGSSGGALYKTVQFALATRIIKFDLDPKDEKVIGKISGVCEYEPSLGYAFQMSFINQNNPTYAS